MFWGAVLRLHREPMGDCLRGRRPLMWGMADGFPQRADAWGRPAILASDEADLANMGQVSVSLGIIDAVAHHEFIWDFKASPRGFHVDFAAAGFV